MTETMRSGPNTSTGKPSAGNRDPTSMSTPPKTKSPIVSRGSVAGNALMLVIGIMTFLLCVTFGAVSLISDTASSWQNDIAREVTIQIRPLDKVDMDKALLTAMEIAASTKGIASVDIMGEEETAQLLEPWLGKGLNLDDLPIPRLLRLTLESGVQPNFAAMREDLRGKVPGASLDDHKVWSERLTTMAGAMVLIGVVIMILVLSATVLTVVFATRGAMSGNHQTIEVLHIVGADQGFIASQFQQHFLLLGLKGGVFGGIAAVFIFLIAGLWIGTSSASPESDQVAALFGSFSVGIVGYLGALAIVILISFLAAYTSRLTVLRHIDALDGST